jgi:hypothetical protein
VIFYFDIRLSFQLSKQNTMAKQLPKIDKIHINDFNPPLNMRANEINESFKNDGWDSNSVPSTATLKGTFYIKKTTFKNEIFRVRLDKNIIGVWIWLIKEGSETKIIISKAERALSEIIIPEAPLNYKIFSNSTDYRGISRTSFDLAWKELKKNEGHFAGIKGFFVGRERINQALDEATLGIQIKVWQDTDNLPTLSFTQVNFGNRFENLGITNIHISPPAGGAGGGTTTRPSPPFREG